MLNDYLTILRNEIVSNFGIYDGVNEFKFIFTVKSSGGLEIDYPSLYEKMFGNKKHAGKYAVAALDRFYGNTTNEIKESLVSIIDGNFDQLKQRDENAIKLLKILAEIVNIVNVSGAREILSSVRDAEEEFDSFRIILSKLNGTFAKEDADRFAVVSKIYTYFKDRRSKLFIPLVDLYSKLSSEAVDYKTAMSLDKKLTKSILKMFEEREGQYIEAINEFHELGMFGKDLADVKEALADQVSDSEIDSYKRTIQFYAKHLDALVELASHNLNSIVTSYSVLNDENIKESIREIQSTFGENSIVHERIVSSDEYLFAVSYVGRYEAILAFIEKHNLKVFSVLMVIPKTENPVTTNPSLRFLITALTDDVDDAIDDFGKKPNLQIKKLGDNEAVYILGTQTNDQEGKDKAMATYLSILAVIHGFDAKKLPFVQKFSN